MKDFRASGVLAINCLTHFVLNHEPEAKKMAEKQGPQREETECPFSATCVNLSCQLFQFFSENQKLENLLESLCKQNEFAFESIFCSYLIVFDRVWRNKKATYMQFNNIVSYVNDKFVKLLKKSPKDVKTLQEMSNKIKWDI